MNFFKKALSELGNGRKTFRFAPVSCWQTTERFWALQFSNRAFLLFPCRLGFFLPAIFVLKVMIGRFCVDLAIVRASFAPLAETRWGKRT